MNTLDRRTLLQGSLGIAALLGTGGALAGCGDGGTSTHGSNIASVKVPSYVPYTGGPTPDLPPNNDGVLAGYLKYPSNPPKLASEKPGSGGSISAFVQTFAPLAPGLSQNKYWQAINDALGVNLAMQVVPANDYGAKLNTMVAGNELPDMFQIRAAINDLPAFLKAKCQELGDFLGGSAAKEYPFLASIPTAYWKASGGLVEGGLYGIPVPRATVGGITFYRADVLSAKGLDPEPASYTDFVKLCKAVTDQRKNTWALANAGTALGFIQQMMGLPNNWKNSGGKLTQINELPQTKEAIARTVELIKAGYLHPDSFGTGDMTTRYKQWFNAGSAIFDGDNWPAWQQWYQQNIAGPKFRVGGMVPPNYDSSSKGVYWQGAPDFSYTVLKKASKPRIKEILKVVNWLAAPFGSAEYLLRKYGVQNVDWKMQNGDPVQTTTGTNEVQGLGIGYIVDAPQVLYYPGFSQATKDAHAFQVKALPNSVADPTLGLYSPTNDSKGGMLGTNLGNALTAILQGRQPLSAWDDAVKKWRQGGGDQIRKEFEEGLAQSGGS
jgi:putative aldouronate transport system substrate-binding protein